MPEDVFENVFKKETDCFYLVEASKYEVKVKLDVYKRQEHFIRAVNATESPKYYLPEEIIPAMYGRKIRIEGGPLSGYEGSLLTTRGSKVKRLLVELEGFLAVGVEVAPEYIQLI